MLAIKPKLTDNIFNNDGYNQLLDDIDATIARMGRTQYEADAFGMDKKVDYNLYEDLCDYREILLGKLMGCNCFEDNYTIAIISRIQKLIY